MDSSHHDGARVSTSPSKLDRHPSNHVLFIPRRYQFLQSLMPILFSVLNGSQGLGAPTISSCVEGWGLLIWMAFPNCSSGLCSSFAYQSGTVAYPVPYPYSYPYCEWEYNHRLRRINSLRATGGFSLSIDLLLPFSIWQCGTVKV